MAASVNQRFSILISNSKNNHGTKPFPGFTQTSKMNSFAKTINDFWPLTIIAKLSILDVQWVGARNAPVP